VKVKVRGERGKEILRRAVRAARGECLYAEVPRGDKRESLFSSPSCARVRALLRAFPVARVAAQSSAPASRLSPPRFTGLLRKRVFKALREERRESDEKIF